MPKRKITDRFVRMVQPASRDVIFWDTHQGGLGLKVTPKGTKSFTVYYRYKGRLRWYHIDRYPAIGLAEARSIAKQVRARAALGQDPHGDKIASRKGETFTHLAEAYFAACKHKSAKQYRGHWERHLKPYLGSRKAVDLGTSEFVDVRNRLERKGKHGTVGPVLATASAIIGWGINEQRVRLSTNPVRGVKWEQRVTNNGRALSGKELIALWPVLDETAGPIWSPVFKLMLFTGQRHDEIRHMRWEHIEDDWWTQPTNKADRVHRVYLSQTARTILGNLSPDENGWVFPNTKGKPYAGIPTMIIQHVRKTSGIADFRPHMFRHTVTTELSRIGIDEKHASRVLNHAEGGVTKRYRHYDFDREKRQALISLERHLLEILSGTSSNDVSWNKG